MMRSLEQVSSRHRPKRVLRRAGIIVITIVAGLAFIPWQQNVSGTGEVAVFSAMDRPQTVEAQIPGRIVQWYVQEGQTVEPGELLVRIEDIDSKFLDDEQPRRLREQRNLIAQGQLESERRVRELENQRTSLATARESSLGAARQAIGQAENRREGLEQALKAAQQTARIAREVAIASARERALQARERVEQADQAVVAAKNKRDTMLIRRQRIAALYVQGLRSKQDDEFAENDLVSAETELERARAASDIARRDFRVGDLARDQASLEADRAQAAVDQAKQNLNVAIRDVTNARLNLTKIQNELTAGLNRAGADIQSARETVAKNAAELRKVEVELGNLGVRRRQQEVRAQRGGRLVRLSKVGPGATVKAGDILATLVPLTADRIIELYLSDNDAPLVRPGRPVRLQFAGFPALQIAGMRGPSIGTFGGRVAFVDPVDDGTARFRVVVRPDRHKLLGGRTDEPWPDPMVLRPGAKAFGWVMLDRVPLGFELWRQLNGFPPKVPKGDEKDLSLGPIKVKTK